MVKSLVIWVIRVPWQSKQNGAAVDVSAEIVSYSYFYWKKYDCNWVTKLCSRYYCNMSRIRPRLIRCHWSFDPRWVKISGHSEQLGPCGSTSHFVNNRHSKVKTRGASCIGGFGQTDGRRKFELGIPQSRGASDIRGAAYIRDKTVGLLWCYRIFLMCYYFFQNVKFRNRKIPLFLYVRLCPVLHDSRLGPDSI